MRALLCLPLFLLVSFAAPPKAPTAPASAPAAKEPAAAPASAPTAAPASAPTAAPASAPVEPPPVIVEALPEAVRLLLRGRMQRHIRDLASLYKAVGAEDTKKIALAAASIADEPALARPTADDQLNASIPPAFFGFQDALRARAEDLRKAAAKGDVKLSREAFEVLGQTCGNCHRTYFPVPRR